MGHATLAVSDEFTKVNITRITLADVSQSASTCIESLLLFIDRHSESFNFPSRQGPQGPLLAVSRARNQTAKPIALRF